jgi:SAM-dependent methyltransferase
MIVPEHEEHVRRWFDRWSHSRTRRRLRPWFAYVQRRVFDRIDWSRVDRLLDVGCGSGGAVLEASRRMRGSDEALACGCDVSLGMLRQGRESRSRFPDAHLLAASGLALPFVDGCFKVVLCAAAFHHFHRPAEALREMRRVLCPGGRVLVAETCRDQSPGTWLWDRLHRWFEKGHVRYYRVDELIELLREAGFEEIRVFHYRPRYAETRKVVSRFEVFSARAPRSKRDRPLPSEAAAPALASLVGH